MKIISLLIALSVSLTMNAQIEKVSFQASGLTCSMCSNAITKALRSLDFVDKVEADISTYTFELTFNNNGIEFEKIKKKVEGAGFSISNFEAVVDFDKVLIQKNNPVIVGSNRIIFVNLTEHPVSGVRKLRLLDKGFVSPKEFRKNGLVSNAGIFHASI